MLKGTRALWLHIFAGSQEVHMLKGCGRDTKITFSESSSWDSLARVSYLYYLGLPIGFQRLNFLIQISSDILVSAATCSCKSVSIDWKFIPLNV